MKNKGAPQTDGSLRNPRKYFPIIFEREDELSLPGKVEILKMHRVSSEDELSSSDEKQRELTRMGHPFHDTDVQLTTSKTTEGEEELFITGNIGISKMQQNSFANPPLSSEDTYFELWPATENPSYDTKHVSCATINTFENEAELRDVVSKMQRSSSVDLTLSLEDSENNVSIQRVNTVTSRDVPSTSLKICESEVELPLCADVEIHNTHEASVRDDSQRLKETDRGTEQHLQKTQTFPKSILKTPKDDVKLHLSGKVKISKSHRSSSAESAVIKTALGVKAHFKDYCSSSAIHGVRYFAEQDRPLIEK